MKKLILVLALVVLGLGTSAYLVKNKDSYTSYPVVSTADDDSVDHERRQTRQVLDLSNKNLTEIQKDFLDNKSIIKLDVSGNALTGSLPAEIRKLTSLEILDASNNKLTGIPAEIGQLENLKEANFANNNISGLPLEIGKLQKLKIFDLRGNPNISNNDVGLIRQQIPDALILSD